MARYIDADLIPYVQSENGVLDDYAFRYDINEIPTANVAPRADVAREVIKQVEQILTVKIIGIEEDFFHGTAAHWDATKRDCYEEVLVELADLKKKYESEGADDFPNCKISGCEAARKDCHIDCPYGKENKNEDS